MATPSGMGYCATVASELAGTAEVACPEENCRNSQYVLTGLEAWAELCPNPALVHVNFGQWDTARFAGAGERLTSPAEYRRNAGLVFRALARRFPGARRIFATTTPMRPGPYEGPHPRYNSDIDEYNALAIEAARECGVGIDDLNAFARDWPAEAFADSCHFTAEAYARLGREVARVIRAALPGRQS
ncbi:MAG: SGNH/GDSL hydrolase family protein [Kiritimatiellia bacterium]